jgi:hypothetical protein
MLLLVGAGLSARVGYPTLDVYASQLVADFSVVLEGDVPTDDSSAVAEAVKTHLKREGRLPAFHAHLERTFGPSTRTHDFDSVHRLLVRGGFRAIATTNYDSVLEDTARADRIRCEEFDLCSRRYPVLDFLRDTSAGRHRSSILHLHGYFRNPKRLVITTRDYFWRYGPYEVAYENGTRVALWRDSAHTKVLWTLFANHPVLFVGFSMRDLALRHILEVLDKGFERGGDLDHYAIMGAHDTDEEAAIGGDLSRFGVKPIFYRVGPPPGPGRGSDHGELEPLISDICAERRGLALTTKMLA